MITSKINDFLLNEENLVQDNKNDKELANEYIEQSYFELKPVIEHFFNNYQGEKQLIKIL